MRLVDAIAAGARDVPVVLDAAALAALPDAADRRSSGWADGSS